MEKAEMTKQELQSPIHGEEEMDENEFDMMSMAPPPFQLTADDEIGESSIGSGTVRQHSMAPPEMDLIAGSEF